MNDLRFRTEGIHGCFFIGHCYGEGFPGLLRLMKAAWPLSRRINHGGIALVGMRDPFPFRFGKWYGNCLIRMQDAEFYMNSLTEFYLKY
jgi:hypothetical protein